MITRTGMGLGLVVTVLLGHAAAARAQSGACCLPGPLCQVLTPAACDAAGGAYGGNGTACGGRDCNLDGIDDFCDIVTVRGADCNGNGRLDECEVSMYCGGPCNPAIEVCSDDCQPDGILDECQLSPWTYCGFDTLLETGLPAGWRVIRQQAYGHTWHLTATTPGGPREARVNGGPPGVTQDERLYTRFQRCTGSAQLWGYTRGDRALAVPPNDRYDVEVWLTEDWTLGNSGDVLLGRLEDWWPTNGLWALFHYEFVAPAHYHVCFRYVGVEGGKAALLRLVLNGTPAYPDRDPDCAGDGVPDECQMPMFCFEPWPTCLLDLNWNDVDDACEISCRGDSNCDGLINWRDIDFLVAAIGGAYGDPDAWLALHAPGHPQCSFFNNDLDEDGYVTWRDIDPFVAAINTACP